MHASRQTRLYIDQPLTPGSMLTLEEAHLHYLKNVMRTAIGTSIRIFNGRDGEYRAEITQLEKNKGAVTLREQLRPQTPARNPVHLLFAPIKKQRLDVLIEKSVELGATDLHPVMTHRTENRKPGMERMHAQIIEAAEQCERLDRPILHPLLPLSQAILSWPFGASILWCHERSGAPHLKTLAGKSAFLVGPEGGFSPEEILFLEGQAKITPVSLGPDILRAETAALYCLANI